MGACLLSAGPRLVSYLSAVAHRRRSVLLLRLDYLSDHQRVCCHRRRNTQRAATGGVGLTDVQDSLFGGVLPGVPVLPVFKLLVSVLVFTEHHHDHALGGGGKWRVKFLDRDNLSQSETELLELRPESA